LVGDMDWLWCHVAEKDKQGTRVWSSDDVIGVRLGSKVTIGGGKGGCMLGEVGGRFKV
jgi:hypothetical protein